MAHLQERLQMMNQRLRRRGQPFILSSNEETVNNYPNLLLGKNKQ